MGRLGEARENVSIPTFPDSFDLGTDILDEKVNVFFDELYVLRRLLIVLFDPNEIESDYWESFTPEIDTDIKFSRVDARKYLREACPGWGEEDKKLMKRGLEILML